MYRTEDGTIRIMALISIAFELGKLKMVKENNLHATETQ